MWLIEQLYIELGPIPSYLSEMDCSNSPVWNIEFDELDFFHFETNWIFPVQTWVVFQTYVKIWNKSEQ